MTEKERKAARFRRKIIVAVLLALYIIVAFLRYMDSRRPVLDLTGGTYPNGKTVECTLEITDYPTVTETSSHVSVSLDGTPGLLYLFGFEGDLAPGDRLSGYFRLYELLWNQNVFRAYNKGEVAHLPGEGGIAFKYKPAVWSKTLRAELRTLFTGDTQALLTAILSGDRSDLSDTLGQQLFTTGLSHVTAVSGLHVTMVAGFFLMILRNRRLAAVFTLPVLLLYTAISGFSASAIRAALMCCIFLLMPVFRRGYDVKRSLAFTFFLMTALDFRLLFTPSFQLSFSATLGLALFGERFQNVFCKVPWGKLRIWRVFASGLSASFASLSLSLPFMAYWFNGVSVIAPLSNALLVWLVSPIFIGGALAVQLSFFAPSAAALLAVPTDIAVKLFLDGVKILSWIPYAVVYKTQPYMLLWLGFAYVLLILALATRRIKAPLTAALCAFVLCLPLTILRAEVYRLEITLLDVGQGQCLVLRSGGETALIDCGGSEKAGITALQALRSVNETRIDYLILTHYDADHVNGVPLLMESLQIGRVFGPEAQSVPDYPVESLSGTEQIALGEATLTLRATDWIGEGNERCITVLVQIDSFALLCTGDIGSATERWLLRTYDYPELDVLVVGHHGSGGSTSAELLDALSPAVALISAGEGNTYGHPHADTLARLNERGTSIYRSDQDGTIRISIP